MMKPIFKILIFSILTTSCSQEGKKPPNITCAKEANGTLVCTDSTKAIQLTPNPIIISDSAIVYSDTSYVELSLKMKDVQLKKISETENPGKRFLNDVKVISKTGVLGRKMIKSSEPVYTKAKPAIKLAGYPAFKNIAPLKHSETAMYDIQHIDQRAQDICWSRDGSAWIASGIEIVHLQGNYIESYGAPQGALSAATNIEVDDLGNVWSAFSGAGYFDGKYFYSFHKKQGFTDECNRRILLGND